MQSLEGRLFLYSSHRPAAPQQYFLKSISYLWCSLGYSFGSYKYMDPAFLSPDVSSADAFLYSLLHQGSFDLLKC